jgi:hypothetical protein
MFNNGALELGRMNLEKGKVDVVRHLKFAV